MTLGNALGVLLVAAMPALCRAADEALPALQEVATTYARLAAASAATRCGLGESVTLTVALSEDVPLDTRYDATTGRLRILYRMNFNQLTEGWNWHPLAPASGGDYYRFKYLPLGSSSEDRGSYSAEDKIGAPQEFHVRWRTDYFFAFDNPYDFYAREPDDDTGFVADITMSPSAAARLTNGDLRMVLHGRLAADCVADSTTFWKATFAQPVDLTLKKRYLIGVLESVWFHDAASGRVLAKISRSLQNASAN